MDLDSLFPGDRSSPGMVAKRNGAFPRRPQIAASFETEVLFLNCEIVFLQPRFARSDDEGSFLIQVLWLRSPKLSLPLFSHWTGSPRSIRISDSFDWTTGPFFSSRVLQYGTSLFFSSWYVPSGTLSPRWSFFFCRYPQDRTFTPIPLQRRISVGGGPAG